MSESMIICDADKIEQYRISLEKHHIPFEHGALMYMISKIKPYSNNVRETVNGFVPVDKWIIENYIKFLDFFPK